MIPAVGGFVCAIPAARWFTRLSNKGFWCGRNVEQGGERERYERGRRAAGRFGRPRLGRRTGAFTGIGRGAAVRSVAQADDAVAQSGRGGGAPGVAVGVHDQLGPQPLCRSFAAGIPRGSADGAARFDRDGLGHRGTGARRAHGRFAPGGGGSARVGRRSPAARPALHLRPVRGRWLQHGRLQCGACTGRARRAALQPAVPPQRHRPGQDASDARDRRCLSRSGARRARAADVGRALHVRFRPGAAQPRHA
ncbi:hypothetical protein D9M73_102400 [compost metagenome]